MVWHAERMDEELMAKKVMDSDMEGDRCRGRPRFGWMDGVGRALGERSMSVEQGGQERVGLIVRSE